MPPQTCQLPPRQDHQMLAWALCERLTARICHDLSGKLGSIAGVLELAADDPAEAVEALETALAGARAAAAHVRLIRAAWGGTEIETADVAALIMQAGRPRVHVDLDGLRAPATLPADTARLLLTALLLAVEALPRGGTVTAAGTLGPDGGELHISPEGAASRWPPDLGAWLGDPDLAWTELTRPDAGPRGLLGPLTVLLARLAGAELALPPPPGAPALAIKLRAAAP